MRSAWPPSTCRGLRPPPSWTSLFVRLTSWHNGLLPHIVFDSAANGYWPGPAEWDCATHNEEAPAVPSTSGIIDPPVHAIAVDRILALAERADGDEMERTQAWAAAIYPKLLAWHRLLARDRADKETGLMTLFHGWESGTDNSPAGTPALCRR